MSSMRDLNVATMIELIRGSGIKTTDEFAGTLKEHVKAVLAPFKYPRWIEFRDELPKTATGKIQRFKLRAEGPKQ